MSIILVDRKLFYSFISLILIILQKMMAMAEEWNPFFTCMAHISVLRLQCHLHISDKIENKSQMPLQFVFIQWNKRVRSRLVSSFSSLPRTLCSREIQKKGKMLTLNSESNSLKPELVISAGWSEYIYISLILVSCLLCNMAIHVITQSNSYHLNSPCCWKYL